VEQTQRPNWKRSFFAIWSGQQFSLIGSSLARFALVWWVTETTGSATALASASLVSLLPGVLLGPFVGALVDRWDRRVVLIVADSFVALVSAWLAYLFWVDAIQIGHVYVVLFLRAIGSTFHWPAMIASTPRMVPEEHLSRVAGLNRTIQGAVGILSPPLGALLLGLLPVHRIMAIDVVTAAFAVVPLFFVSIPRPARSAAEASTPSLWADTREGFRYTWSWPGLRAIILLGTVVNLLINPAMSLLPILVTRHFGGGALHLGWLNSSWGVGLVVGGLIMSAWSGFRRRIVTTLVGIAGLGFGVLLTGLAPASTVWLALIGLFLGAAMNAMSNAALVALLQQSIAPDMQGRVFSLGGSLANAATPLGMAIAGPLVDAIGVRTLYVVVGVLYVLVGVGAFFVPLIVRFGEDPDL
jgi:DHA3 family macrolide efflux protein-like MFS transporter